MNARTDSTGPSQDGSSSKRQRRDKSPGRIRRAARGELSTQCKAHSACDRCRSSKLRCQPDKVDPFRCAHCVKMELECEYNTPHTRPPATGDNNQRLDQLESSVSKILELLQGGATRPTVDLSTVGTWSTNDPLSETLATDYKVPESAQISPRGLRPSLSPLERYDSAQARPLPKVGSDRRMAAFRESFAYEAPFRSIAYNPDTYRNAEVESEPSRRRGDPIDLGIFTEDKARELFAL